MRRAGAPRGGGARERDAWRSTLGHLAVRRALRVRPHRAAAGFERARTARGRPARAWRIHPAVSAARSWRRRRRDPSSLASAWRRRPR